MGPFCNTTLTEAKYKTTPLWHGMSFHRLGSFFSAVCALFATVLSLFLIFQHARHYSKPNEQKNIIRIVFMVPIYSCVSFLSYVFYQHAIYFEVVRDCYEAVAIASFFALLCYYIAPDLSNQKDHFRGVKPKEWLWPLSLFKRCCGGDRGIWRRPRSGLTWFNIIWIGIFQYCFIRVSMTIVSVITQSLGRYCESSLNPAFAHVWTMVINATAVTIAMYCLIEFYRNLRDDLASHRPFLKLLCIKLVIFLSFWQTLMISFLTSGNILKPSDTISYSDLKVGVPSMLLCIEMAIFSVLHLFAFNWKEYTTKLDSMASGSGSAYKGGPLGAKAIFDAFNLWDLVKAAARGFRWLFVGRRQRMTDRSYNTAPTSSGHLTEPDTTYHGPADDGYGKLGSKPDNSQPVPSAEERLELLDNAQPAPVSPMYPDSLPIKNPEPSMIGGFSEPPKQSVVYPAARQHNSKPKHSSQTPYPDGDDPFTDPPQGRFSYDEGPEQLSHPGDVTTGPGRGHSPPGYSQGGSWPPSQQQPPNLQR